eukprot:gene13796-16305_t
MECPRCPGQHHNWYQCQNKDKGAEHQPTNREVKTMALVQIFNDAAQQGAGAMRACIAQHGEPVVLEDGVVLPRQRRDLSYLGFTVERDGSGGGDADSDFGDDDALASFTHATFYEPAGGAGLEPAAEQGGDGQGLVQQKGGEIVCEPCEKGATPMPEISAVPTRPTGCGTPPLGASQRLIWTVVLQLVVLQNTTSTKITTTNWRSMCLLEAVWQETVGFSILAGVLCQWASTT